MKTPLFTFALGLVCAVSLAQMPAPVPPAPAPAPIKLPPTLVAPTPQALLQQLQVMRDANAKLLEQQAKTLIELDAMEKTSQMIKMMGKRT